MTQMIERVARAIASEQGDAWPMGSNHYLELSRAAIEAMQKPTDAMFEAAKPYGLCMSALDDAWQDMIEAALDRKNQSD